jgi:hypothetical protein
MTAFTVPTFVEVLADPLRTVLERLSGPAAGAERTLDGVVGGVEVVLLAVPPAVWIVVAGLSVWRGHRLGRAVVTVLALQLIVLSGTWPDVGATVSFGLVAGTAAAMVLTVSTVVRRKLRPHGSPLRSIIGVGDDRVLVASVIAICGVGIVALAAVSSAAGQPAWGLMGIVLTIWLAMGSRWASDDRLAWGDLPRSVLLVGIPGALLTGLVSGRGLGGLGTRAAETTDVLLMLQVFLAIVGSSAALIAGLGRPPSVRRPEARTSSVEAADAEPSATAAGAPSKVRRR